MAGISKSVTGAIIPSLSGGSGERSTLSTGGAGLDAGNAMIPYGDWGKMGGVWAIAPHGQASMAIRPPKIPLCMAGSIPIAKLRLFDFASCHELERKSR